MNVCGIEFSETVVAPPNTAKNDEDREEILRKIEQI